MGKWKRILSMLLVCCMLIILLPTTVFAATTVAYAVEGGNIYFDPSTGAIVNAEKTITLAEIPDKIEGIPVTSINPYAFKDCRSLEFVSIQDGIQTIGLESFSGCSSLWSIGIPRTVASIDYGAFNYCPKLRDIYFAGDGSSKSIQISSSPGWYAYAETHYNCLPPSFERPIAYAVEGGNIYFEASSGTIIGADNSITKVEIPCEIEGIPVRSIGFAAFMSCRSLKDVIIPESVVEICESAFASCESLIHAAIAHGTAKIGQGAFSFCSNLKVVTIPDSVTEIGNAAFFNCKTLEYITLPSKLTSIGFQFFQGCSNLKEITIPETVTLIDGSAFELCDGLKTVTIPGSVKKIGDSAFYWCSNLNTVKILDGTTLINQYAFDRCSNLLSVSLPRSLTTIGEQAFANCGRLSDIYYAGSKEEWDSVYKNFALSASVTIHYNSTGESVDDSTSTDHFDVSVYRAAWLQKAGTTEDAIRQSISDKTPSTIFVRELQESDFEKAVTLWEAADTISQIVDNPIDGIADFVMEPKDMYSAILLNALEDYMDDSVSFNLIANDYEQAMKDCDKFVSRIKDLMKTESNWANMDTVHWHNLSAVQREQLSKWCQEYMNKDFKNNYADLCEIGEVFTGVTTVFDTVDTLENYYQCVVSSLSIASMNEDMKKVLYQLYADSQVRGNAQLQLAVLDIVKFLDDSTAEVLAEVLAEKTVLAGVDAIGYFFGELVWDEVMSKVKVAHPAVAVLSTAYKTSKYISNLTFNTDTTIEKYMKMLATLDIESLIDGTYAGLQTAFLQSQNVESAKTYLAALDLVFTMRDRDTVAAYNFVDALDQSLISKINKLFGKDDFADTKKVLRILQENYLLNHSAALSEWVNYLDVDYPESGLYEYYTPIVDDAILKKVVKKGNL